MSYPLTSLIQRRKRIAEGGSVSEGADAQVNEAEHERMLFRDMFISRIENPAVMCGRKILFRRLRTLAVYVQPLPRLTPKNRHVLEFALVAYHLHGIDQRTMISVVNVEFVMPWD